MIYFFKGVNIFVMKRDRGGRGSEKSKISVTSFMNGPFEEAKVLLVLQKLSDFALI